MIELIFLISTFLVTYFLLGLIGVFPIAKEQLSEVISVSAIANEAANVNVFIKLSFGVFYIFRRRYITKVTCFTEKKHLRVSF